MKICQKLVFCALHIFPCPLLYVGSAVCYLNMFSLKISNSGEFPRSLVIEIQGFQSRWCRFDLCSGN